MPKFGKIYLKIGKDFRDFIRVPIDFKTLIRPY